jgi:predicted dehydrogenase
MFINLRKILRFISIYGIIRTLFKVAGRMRAPIPIWWLLYLRYPIKRGRRVGVIGCGQFSFSAIAYFLAASTKCRIEWCCDIDDDAAKSFASAYGLNKYSNECTQFLKDTDLVYIASNHASHTGYAIECLKAGCDVYIEKPISTTWEQFEKLLVIASETKKNIYVGYNRPHSPSINLIKQNISDNTLPFTLSCFITGHFIPEDHWYRDPKEGTRVCGNLGHWLDLAVHIIYWSGKTLESISINITYSDKITPSDNFSVALSTPRGDLISLTFSSRSEPFEGVNESINFQQGNLIAKINDHRHTQLWIDEKYKSKRYWPKNVGHKCAILQPFMESNKREWDELVVSNKLILVITDMVKNLETSNIYKFQ